MTGRESVANEKTSIAPVTASDLLDDQHTETPQSRHVKTGVEALDKLLNGGFERGKVTELWSAPGAGRDAIALAATQELIKDGRHVTWLSCAHPLSYSRLVSIAQHEDRLHQIIPPTLSHLIAIARYPASFLRAPAPDLLVVDDLSSLIDLEYPRQSTFTTSADSDLRKWQATRRHAILASIVTYLNQLAVSYNAAVVVMNGCATTSRSRSGQSAILVSAVGGLEWEAGVWCRVALFCDFNGRFAALQRSRGSNVPASGFHDNLALFTVDEHGFAAGTVKQGETTRPELVVVRSNKRKLEEIADSDGELDEYGWNGDEELEVQIVE